MRRDWEYKKLGEVVAPKNQIQRALKCFNKTDIIKYLDISSIDNSKYQISAYTEYALENAPSRAQQKVEINDIIISLVRPNLKNIARIEIKDHSLVASSGFCVLRTTELIDNNYLFYFISSQKYTDYLVGVTAGANYPAVKESDIRDSLIPIPPKSTQLAIVAELDKLNEMIRLKKQQLEDYDQLAQSIFYEMFGDPVENEKGWEMMKLGEICSKIGSGATPKGGNNSYIDFGISLIRSLNIHNNIFKYEDLAHIDETQAKALSNVIINKDDILLNITGASVARCCIVPDNVLPARVNQHVCIIRPIKENGNSFYLNRLLTSLSYQTKLMKLAKSKAATREALPKSIVVSLMVPLPPLPLQQQFAVRIEAIEQQKQQVKDTIKDLETLLASRMQYWFD